MNRLDLEQHLRRHGCEFDHHGAKHDFWANPAVGKVVPIPRHRVVKRGTVRGVCRDLGIPRPPGL